MQASAQEFYEDMYGYPSGEFRGQDAEDLHGYVNDGMPIDTRRSALYFPIANGDVQDRTTVSHARTAYHSHRYTPYHQPVPSLIPFHNPTPLACGAYPIASGTHPIVSVQLVPDNSIVLNQGPEILSRLPTVSANGILLSPVNTCFTDPIFSPTEDHEQPFVRLINPAFRKIEESSFSHMTASTFSSTALLPAGPPIVAYPAATVIVASTESDEYGALNSGENDPTIPSLPIVKLALGAWKCVVCDRVLRRKHRAVVHFWNKHGGMRLNCIGRCGWIDCDKSFASQDGLDVHLNPVLVDCSSCGKSLLKKNIIRHRDRHCRLAGNEIIESADID